MKKQNFLLSSIVVAMTMATSGSAIAAGFQLNGQSATGLGRAFAGDAVIADNASVMGRNAAAMALFDRPEISLGLVVIDSAPTVKDAKLDAAIFGINNRPISDTEIGELSYVPNVYYVHPLDEKIALGVGVYSHFGTTTMFPDGYEANLFGGSTKLETINLGIAASYRINSQWSLGAGFDFIQGSGELRRYSNQPLAFEGLNISASGIAVGWNLGAVYEINQNHRFGLSYRYSPTVEAEIDHGGVYRNQPLTGDLILPLADIAEFSGYHKLTEKFAAHYSVQWIGWQTFDNLTTTGDAATGAAPTVLNEYQWKNSWHFSLGGTYNLNEKITLRAGYMFDMSAQDDKKSISVPDSDRHWVSAGASYAFTPNSTIDFGLTYLMGSDVQVNESISANFGPLPLTATVDATTKATAWLYGIQYTYKF